MILNIQTGRLFGSLFGTRAVARALGEPGLIGAMVRVERALAQVQGRLGVIPSDDARRIDEALQSFSPDMEGLERGSDEAGLAVPALVTQLRDHVGGDAASSIHHGATSHDILDTAWLLQLNATLEPIEQDLDALIRALGDLARNHLETVMVGRTRGQQATLTTFGLKAAQWRAQLVRRRRKLADVKADLLVVQMGGATGTLAAMGEAGLEVMEGLAHELDLGAPAAPWHTRRDGVIGFGDWLVHITDAVGKIGLDVMLLSQNEVAEVREGRGGGSSTMPNKRNPVRCEALGSLSRYNAVLLSGLHLAAAQEQERGGVGWQLEWLTLPPMVATTAAVLTHGRTLIDQLEVDGPRMARNIEASNGLVLAEAASFELSRFHGRAEAQRRVKRACAEALAQDLHLFDILATQEGDKMDWARLRTPDRHIGQAMRLAERLLELD
ncbi:MAG: 3-carboxy-cis,cis-muconate cycloisomerase [Geminicoccaceae bacterium]